MRLTSSGSRSARGSRSGSLALVLGIGALAAGVMLARSAAGARRARAPDSAPLRSRWSGLRGRSIVGRTVTINKPRAELYAFWRDFRNLPRFMENIESVRQSGDGRTIWSIAAPAGRTVEIETEIVAERENELIAWRSLPGSHVATEGQVRFSDAPAGRGTRVEAVISYRPPAGDLGRLIAKLFQREPEIQGRRELKRLKMLMETGEVATSANRLQPA